MVKSHCTASGNVRPAKRGVRAGPEAAIAPSSVCSSSASAAKSGSTRAVRMPGSYASISAS